MKIITYLSNAGIPAEDMTPKITIRKVSDKSVIINNSDMNEIGNGFYDFEFDDYQEGNTYVVLVNGGDSIAQSERYHHGIIQDIDVNSAISFIKGIEGGMWELKDNQMIFYKEDNKTELTRFNLKNNQGQPSMADVFKRTKHYTPTSGKIIFKFADLLSKTGALLIPEGIYTLSITIDEFPINVNISVITSHTLNNLLSNIQIAIRNATQKQETVFQDGNQIVIQSFTTGYNSNVKNHSGTLISEVFLILGCFSQLTEVISGYGTEGPI